MRSLKSGLIAITAAGLFGSLAVVGCSADGGSGDIETDTPATDPEDNGNGAQLPPPSNNSPGASASTDGGKKDGGTKKTDSGVDAGPPPPQPGDPCTKADAEATRPCGACGIQKARCEAIGDAGTLQWSEYGFCAGELTGGCIPGTSVTEACGNCGTLTKTCTKTCGYTSSKCGGEPNESCAPGTVLYTTAGCQTANTYASKTCGASCTWGSLSSTCAAPNNPNKLTISGTKGQSVKATYTLSPSETGNKPTKCNPSGNVAAGKYERVFVEVKNTTSKKATVTIYQSKATGGPELDLMMSIYRTTLPPQDDKALMACEGSPKDNCLLTTPSNVCGCSTVYDDYGDFVRPTWAGISDVEIPAGGAILVLNNPYTMGDKGDFVLNVRTDNLQ